MKHGALCFSCLQGADSTLTSPSLVAAARGGGSGGAPVAERLVQECWDLIMSQRVGSVGHTRLTSTLSLALHNARAMQYH